MSDDIHPAPRQASPAPRSSADRARFWASLNRSLRTEVDSARRLARPDRDARERRGAGHHEHAGEDD